MAMKYLIWSTERGAWWRPAERGYTRDILEAGRYSRVEAIELCRRALPGQWDGTPLEIPVADKDVREMLKDFALKWPPP
jgi:hypothetical protein